MKGKWGYAVLALSLAVHAGFLGVFIARRIQRWNWDRAYERKWLKPGHSIKEVDALFNRYDMANTRIDTAAYWEARRAVGRMGLAEGYDSTELARALEVLVREHRPRYRNRYELMRGLHELNSDRWNEGIRKWKVKADRERRREDSTWDARVAERRAGRKP
jgi:hypothetical protein